MANKQNWVVETRLEAYRTFRSKVCCATQDLSLLSSRLTDKVPVTFNLLGLVSGATIIMPCSDAVRCAPALVMKFCSVHVRPKIKHILM